MTIVRVVAQDFIACVVVGKFATPIIAALATMPLSVILLYCRCRGWRAEVCEVAV